ncbi:hypothetical protein ATCC90586_010437 [Pythium insidiosum]|nr:hypothetical protein ATCC90586_010437 [Pythium insidiosum]
MADPEPETLARWRANRRRMVRDLQQQIDTLLDRAEAGSLDALSPDGDAMTFSCILSVLTDAADGNTAALRSLAAVDASADSSMVHEARGSSGTLAATEELARLRERIADLETHVGELTDVARARSDRIEGLQQVLDAYRSFGEVEEVQASLERWRSIAGVLLGLVIDSEQVCAQYEAVLGPVLLQLDRRCSSLSAFLRSLAGAASPPIQPSRGLLAGLADLGVDPDGVGVDLHTAVTALRRREQSAGMSDVDLSDLRQHPLMVLDSAEFRALLQSTGRGGDASGPSRVCPLLGLLDESALTALYESLRSAGRVSTLRVFESALPGRPTDGAASAGGRPPKRQQHRGTDDVDNETARPSTAGEQEVIVLSESDSAKGSDVFDDHASSSDDERSLALVTLALSSRKKHNIVMPPSQSKLAKIRDVELRRFQSNADLHLGLFRDEVLTPKTSEYSKFVDTTTHRYPTMDEIDRFYATQPWKRIMSHLEPTLFDDKDPHFAGMTKNARALYRRHAQALWERTHCFLPADDEPGRSTKVKSRRTTFLDRRRKRNSDLTPCWLGHLELVLKAIVTCEVDADVLLDPFFVWPPVFGVALVIPLRGESLSACARVEPVDGGSAALPAAGPVTPITESSPEKPGVGEAPPPAGTVDVSSNDAMGQPAQFDSQSSKPSSPRPSDRSVAPDTLSMVALAAAAVTSPSQNPPDLASTPVTEI